MDIMPIPDLIAAIRKGGRYTWMKEIRALCDEIERLQKDQCDCDRLSPEATREILHEIKYGTPDTPERIETFRRIEELRAKGKLPW